MRELGVDGELEIKTAKHRNKIKDLNRNTRETDYKYTIYLKIEDCQLRCFGYLTRMSRNQPVKKIWEAKSRKKT